LDTGNIENYVETIHELNLTNYVTYDVTDEELKSYGMDDPELTVTLRYRGQDEESGEEKEETVVLHISRDPDEKEKAESEAAKSSDDDESQEDTETDSKEEVTAYLRVGESKIIYQISGLDYEDLMEASYNDLRHQEVIWADFEDISGVVYDMVCTPESEKEAENADSMEEWKNALIYSENSFVADFDEMVQNRIVECILREQIVRYDRPGEYLETWHRYLKGEVV